MPRFRFFPFWLCSVQLLRPAGNYPNGLLHDNPPTALAWSPPLSIDPSRGFPDSVSCTSSKFCMAVDYYGAAFVYRGGTWSAPETVDHSFNPVFGYGLASVSCASSSFCVAVDGAGNVLTYNGKTWSSPKSIDPPGRYKPAFASVSCASPTFCVTVDYSGNAFTYRSKTWTRFKSVDPNGDLSSVSCASPTFCMAVDNMGNALMFNGWSWSAPKFR